MTVDPSSPIYSRYNRQRIASRQVDELIGLARGLCADGVLNDAEVQFLQKWLAINADFSGQPIVTSLYDRVNQVLNDGLVDADERRELFDALTAFSDISFELGEDLKPAILPLCLPPPEIAFGGRHFCFTGTFNFGRRRDCEDAVENRGGLAGSLTKDTNYLVIGAYVTVSWRHSSFGNKILKAVEMRDSKDVRISIVSEQHWAIHL